MQATQSRRHAVVPHTGDVDRNTIARRYKVYKAMSSPTRGTWIEILKGETDGYHRTSSPTRGTWIEI